MIEINMIDNVYNILLNMNNIYIIGWYKASNIEDFDYQLTKPGGYFQIYDKYIFYQLNDFSDTELIVFDSNFKQIDNFGLHSVLFMSYEYEGKFYIHNRNTKSLWQIDKNLKQIDLSYSLSFVRKVGNFLIKINGLIPLHLIDINGNVLWQVDLTKIGTIKKKTKEGVVILPNATDTYITNPIFADEKTIFVPMKGGQLIAINANDGSVKWIFETEHVGFYAIYGNRIYKKSNFTIYEIDANTGELLRTKTESEILKGTINPFFTQSFKAYDDYLVFKNQVRENFIALVNRKTLELEEYIPLDVEIGESLSNYYWQNNQLYVLDMNKTLHIFEKQNNENV